MGDGRQLWTALEPDVDVVLRDGGELTLPTGNEPVPAHGDGFLAAATTTATIAATLVPTAPFIFPINATGATTTIATATTIAGVTFDIGLVYGDAITSPTLLSSPARRRQSNRQQRL